HSQHMLRDLQSSNSLRLDSLPCPLALKAVHLECRLQILGKNRLLIRLTWHRNRLSIDCSVGSLWEQSTLSQNLFRSDSDATILKDVLGEGGCVDSALTRRLRSVRIGGILSTAHLYKVRDNPEPLLVPSEEASDDFILLKGLDLLTEETLSSGKGNVEGLLF